LFDPSNALVEFNRKLHSNALYNGFQIAVNALAVFSAGAASTMSACCRYNDIDCGRLGCDREYQGRDKVIATNPETFEVARRRCLRHM